MMRFLKLVDRSLRRWVETVIYETRRTRRVIVAPNSRTSCEAPIFITGVHRSGTTLVRLILDSHPSIATPPESFFIVPLNQLIEDEKAMEGLRAMGFDEEHVLRRLRETVSYFFEMYAAARQKRRWADKTPSYISCLDFIDRLFGSQCRYVLIYRHGLDVAASLGKMDIRDFRPHVAACGGDRFAGAARHWSEQCQVMLDFHAKHPEQCFELRYEELTSDPEPNLRRLFEFLEEPWDPDVLRFHEQPHDYWIGLQDGKAAESKGFERRSGAWREQPPQVIEAMIREAGPMLEKLGYSTSADAPG